LTAQSSPLEALLHQTIKKVSHDIESHKMNTAVSSLMVLFNEMEKVQRTNESPCRVEFKTFVRLLAPFAPHVAEELWEKIGGEGSVHAAMWSQYDESEIAAETTTIVLQIDGKTRGSFQIAAGAPPEEVERLARQTLGKRLENAEVARVVYVPDRLVNFVLART
ncbi:MAG: class I tRNA ligase family protein, partial [Minisyncoccia bacterium]